MPTYEYACDACDHRWEEFQPMSAEPTTKCPACKKKKAKRLISAGGGLIFKGSGFYITDYRSDNYKNSAKSDSSSSESAPAKSDSSSSSTPASAPAPTKSESKSSGKKSKE
jgi:putative FmdB family regulatory protein